jgi:Spy/CpxP family protein refolding chaperone
MKIKSNMILAVLFVLAVVFTATPFVKAEIFGQKPPMPGMKDGPEGGPFFGLKFCLELKLSDSQQAKMKKIINKYQDEEKRLRNNMMESRKNLMSVMHTEPFDEAAARKAFRNTSSLEEDAFVLRAKIKSELDAVLTSDQKEMLKKRREHKMKRVRRHFDPPHENDGE